MYRSVFLHEFPDRHIANLLALPGNLSPESRTLRPSPTVLPNVNSIQIANGTGLSYGLATPLQRVIGVSLRLRLLVPPDPAPQLFSVLSLGSDAELLLWPSAPPSTTVEESSALVRLWLGSGFKNLAVVQFPARRFVDLRIDWHTSGQARLLLDGALVGYRNDVAPGAAIRLEKVQVGTPGSQPVSSESLCHVGRIFVRALERDDAVGLFSKLLPSVKPVPDPLRCRGQALAELRVLLERVRGFLQNSHQILTRNWSEAAGPATGPFEPAAVEAHRLAVEAGAELFRILRTQDYSEPNRFLDPFAAMLRLLRDAQPQQFAILAAEIDAHPIVSEQCRADIDAQTEANRETLGPLIQLLKEASEQVRSIAGGQ